MAYAVWDPSNPNYDQNKAAEYYRLHPGVTKPGHAEFDPVAWEAKKHLQERRQKDEIAAEQTRQTNIANNAADKYWDATSQSWKTLGNIDPGSEGGRYALTNALADSNSAASNQFYYGGSRDAAGQIYNGLQQKAYQLENRGPLASDMGDYSETVDKQYQLNRYLSDIQRGQVTTPGQQQLSDAYVTNQANLRAQLSSAQGGLVAAAAARNASRTAAENSMRTFGRDMAVQKMNDKWQAANQQSGLLNAMRTSEQNAAFLDAERNQEYKMQNLNTGAAVSKFGLAALEQGLQGNINRQRARNEAYSSAVGISQKQNKFNSDIENQNLNTTLGAFESAGVAGGKLIDHYQKNDNQPADNSQNSNPQPKK